MTIQEARDHIARKVLSERAYALKNSATYIRGFGHGILTTVPINDEWFRTFGQLNRISTLLEMRCLT